MRQSLKKDSNNRKKKTQVVIIGAGFGGLSLARDLKHASVDIVLIDRHNYHLFQPLLYQVATAGLSATDIAWPIRSIFKKQNNIQVVMDEVVAINPEDKTVKTQSGNCYSYDYLALATGSRHSYFGNEVWENFAPGIKTIKDALILREKILLAFEKAEMEEDPDKRQAYLTFVIVGAGPTGVEIAGALVELTRFTLAKDFHHISPQKTKIILAEAGPRILTSFPEKLSTAAKNELSHMGVEVLVNTKVLDIVEGKVILENKIVHSNTIIWAAGVQASSAARWLNLEADSNGRVKVGADLSVQKYDNIFAIGDTSACYNPKTGTILPGIAPVAKQQGRYIANLITRKLSNQKIKPFKYRDYGNLATIGRKYAVTDFGLIKLKGFLAWILWSIVHIYFLIGFKNRFSVSLSWLWSYITYQRGARLIVDSSDDSED
jgi:NADH dehydrogenase